MVGFAGGLVRLDRTPTLASSVRAEEWGMGEAGIGRRTAGPGWD